jgi:hypothetical protein
MTTPGFLASDPTTAVVFVAIGLGSFPLYSTILFAAFQDILPNDMRGLGIAMTGLINTLIGAAAAPFLVALATEHLYRDPKQVGLSIVTVSIPAAFAASALAWLTYRRASAGVA